MTMDAKSILKELRSLGRESTRRVLLNHGAKEPCYGVRIADLKPIQRRIKKDYELALALYDSGVYDAMYLAGLVADDARMTKGDLQRWVRKAQGGCLAGTTVASVAAESAHGWELALRWIDSPKEHVAEAGWSTLSMLVALKPDDQLDPEQLRQLMGRVKREIGCAPNAARYAMNQFLISVGCYVESLTALAIETGETLGLVEVDMGDTACKVPFAPDYIRKVKQRGTIGRKRKTVKC
jgi:3-methyladenine DNA glycosylase AlkD